ncbi:MAG: phosphatase PAP2 family protein [Rhizobiaceae bacterium]|nr:phosphatase PAP2 family protein [Rhizobiaceae bacterium]
MTETPTPHWQKQMARSRVHGGAWLMRFDANIRSALAFAERRRRARPALAGRTLAWRRYSFLGAIAVIFAFTVFDPVVGTAGPKAYGPIRAIAEWTTEYGKSGWYIWPLAIGLIICMSLDWSRRPSRAKTLLFYRTSAITFALTAVAGSGILASVLKLAIGRARPRLYDTVGAFHFEPFSFEAVYASFPSGHSTTFGAVCGAVALLFPRFRMAAVVFAVWFGSTRIVVGAHYPSDVVAGLMFGAWFAGWTAYQFGKRGLVFDLPAAGGVVPKRSFHLVEIGRHRRLSSLLDDAHAWLYRLGGKAPPRRLRGAIDS